MIKHIIQRKYKPNRVTNAEKTLIIVMFFIFSFHLSLSLSPFIVEKSCAPIFFLFLKIKLQLSKMSRLPLTKKNP